MKAKIWQTILSVLIGIILVAVVAICLAIIIRHARALVKLEDITVDKGAVTYLASLYKKHYISDARDEGVDASDTEAFWQSEKTEGVTFGDDLKTSFDEYIKALVADAHLYTVHHGYTVEDKLAVSEMNDKILLEYANGSVAYFNEVADVYGFDYSDFKDALALMYKASKARELLPDLLGAEEYERQLEEAKASIHFGEKYYSVDVVTIHAINEYYVR